MAIQINPPNFGGLASSGASGGIPNLSVPGALGLQGLQIANARRAGNLDRQQQAQEAYMRNATAQQQLAQQGLLANQANDTAQQQMAQSASQYAGNQAADAAKLAAQQGQNDRVFGQEEQKIAIDKQRADQEGMAKHMAKLLDMDKKELQSRGAQAAYGLMALKGAKTPEESQQIRTALLQDSVSKKIITPEQAAQAAKAPLSQFTAMLGQELIATGQASEYAAAQKAMNPAADRSGNHIEFYSAEEGGGIKEINQDPSAANKTKAQDAVNDRSMALIKLGEMTKNFDPENFTRVAQGKNWISKQAEVNKGLPGIGAATEAAASAVTGQSAKERAKAITSFTDYMNEVEQFFNQTYKQPMTGAAVGKEELKNLRSGYLSGDMSPSEFQGGLKQLIRKFAGEKEFNQNFLRKGVDVTPDAAFEQARKDPRYADRSDEQLRRDIAYTNRRQ